MKTAFCFDMDGTLTKTEVLPLIAREVGIESEISVLTKATIEGLLPFEQSFNLRVKLLADCPIARVSDIVNNVATHELMLKFIKANLDNCFVVTGNLDVWIEKYLKNIGCKYFCSESLIKDNKINGIKSTLQKAAAIKKIRELGYDRIVSVGDGMNDMAMFEESDISIAFGGVHKPADSLIKISDYVTFSERGVWNILKML